jgi:hypothetical protein
MVPHVVFVPSSSVVSRGVIPVERPWQEGSSAHGAGAEPSQTLIQTGTNRPWLELVDLQNPGAPPFVLDDPTKEKEWRHCHGIMGGVAHLLNATLVMANDRLKLLNSATNPCTVWRACALIAAFCFVASNLCSFRSC